MLSLGLLFAGIACLTLAIAGGCTACGFSVAEEGQGEERNLDQWWAMHVGILAVVGASQGLAMTPGMPAVRAGKPQKLRDEHAATQTIVTFCERRLRRQRAGAKHVIHPPARPRNLLHSCPLTALPCAPTPLPRDADNMARQGGSMLGPVIGGAAAGSVGFSGAMVGAGLLCLGYAAINFGSLAFLVVGRVLGFIPPAAAAGTSPQGEEALRHLVRVSKVARAFNQPGVAIDVPHEMMHAEWVKVHGVVEMLSLFGEHHGHQDHPKTEHAQRSGQGPK